MKSKIVSREEAVAKIKDNDVVAGVGAQVNCCPEGLFIALEERFLHTGSPKNLTLIGACALGLGKTGGGNHLAHEGMLKKAVLGHFKPVALISKMVAEEKIEGYCIPQGVFTHLYRDIAAKKPGLLTEIGLGTFIDPRLQGGAANAISKDKVAELLNIEGKEYLLYKTFPIDIALIRGTTADSKGNVSLEKEPAELECLALAQAVRNSGGIVIVQVERIAADGAIPARNVRIPGAFVDYIVVCQDVDLEHRMTTGTTYHPSFSGELKTPYPSYEAQKHKDDITAVICKRAALEIISGDVINIGLGIPAGVAYEAHKSGILQETMMSVELGAFGGQPAAFPNFGAVWNPDAYIPQPSMFDFYHGGGLSVSFVGAGELDHQGNINVSKLGNEVGGTGGFIDITQPSQRIVFCMPFKDKDLEVKAEGGVLKIVREGLRVKCVRNSAHITFSGEYARKLGKKVLIVTERCVFSLEPAGVMLAEIAPGIRLEEDILKQMDFQPLIAEDLKIMPAGCFDGEA
ncbi:MAG: acyl CoA:acetate/3-ketoacid CoA transferase [Peptococcaceae bacterium]|jgi:propionate CoA-transferase|nr:acyl CoA:acetate/3-ketoacid CoA transferase [Peptococcaceae bacterium]